MYKSVFEEFIKDIDVFKSIEKGSLSRIDLCFKGDDNINAFREWKTKADKIINNTYQKYDYEEALKLANIKEANNPSLLLDRSESSLPWTIIKRKIGNLSKFNIKPNISSITNDETKKDISYVNSYIESIFLKNNYIKEHNKVLEDSCIYGTGVMMLDYSPMAGKYKKLDGDIVIKYIPIENMVVDATMNDIEDMAYVGHYEIKDEYLFKVSLTPEQVNNMQRSIDVGNGNYISAYSNLYNIVQEENINGNVIVHQLFFKMYKENKLKTYKVQLMNGIIYEVEELPFNYFPYRSITFFEQNNNFYGKSLLYSMLDSYEMLLRMKDSINSNALFASNPIYEVNTEAISGNIEDLTVLLNVPGSVIPSVNGSAVRMIDRTHLTAEFYNGYSLAKDEMQSTAGETKFTSGESAGSITTSTGVLSMLDAGNVGNQVDIPIIERFVTEFTTVFLAMLESIGKSVNVKVLKDDKVNYKTLKLTQKHIDNMDIIIKAKSEIVNESSAITYLIQLYQVVASLGNPETDKLKDTLMVNIINRLPLDKLEREKITREIDDVAKDMREQRDAKKETSFLETVQSVVQQLPPGKSITDYIK